MPIRTTAEKEALVVAMYKAGSSTQETSVSLGISNVLVLKILDRCGVQRKKIKKREYHGLCYTPEYRVWLSIIDRCNNHRSRAYQYYGGRGIKISNEWRNSFATFVKDMGRRPPGRYSVERIDVNGDYNADNCVWIDSKKQMGNTRRTVRLTHNGKSMTIKEWSAALNIPCATIANRRYRGLPITKILSGKVASASHGVCNQRRSTYISWRNAKRRCNCVREDSYDSYGGRGILMCQRWSESFELFLVDMGPRPSRDHSLDRIDCNGNYEPGNCRWATRSQQAGNKRNSIRIVANGAAMSVGQWSQESGIPKSVIYNRIRIGMPHEEAVTRPWKALSGA